MIDNPDDINNLNPEDSKQKPVDDASETEKLKSHNEKLIEEKRNAQKRADELQAKLDAAETEKLKAKEDQSDYIKKLEKDIEAERERVKANNQKTALSKLREAFVSEATKNGCIQVDDLQRLHANELKDVRINPETFEVDTESISRIIAESKKNRPFYFKEKAADIDDVNFKKPIQEDYRTELNKCKTQKELDTVMKKYGKI